MLEATAAAGIRSQNREDEGIVTGKFEEGVNDGMGKREELRTTAEGGEADEDWYLL